MCSDVLILGGGPAGGATAFLMARAGLSVTLCEANAVLPERVCGMYLCPAGVALLDQMGIRARVAGEARRLRGMVMVAPNLQRLETHFPTGELIPEYGLSVVRPAFDQALLDLAREHGARVEMGARPVKLERIVGGWRATFHDREPIEARLLVGADGRKSATARMLGVTLPLRRTRTAIHIDCPALGVTRPFGEMHVFDDGAYVGLNPITPEQVNFSIVCDPDALRRRSAVEFINDRIRLSPWLREMLGPLPLDARPGTTFPINARVRSAATQDAALVGDASGYIDPLTGEGIYAALWTADELARSVTDGWEDLPAALAHYARHRERRQRTKALLCELFQQVICRPVLANGVHWLLSRRTEVADAFIGIIGNSYPPAQGLVRMAQQLVSTSSFPRT